MNREIQLGMVPLADPSLLNASVGAALSRFQAPQKSLIETAPRIEIAITHSFKRRKHFLIETRIGVWFASGTVSLAPETAKINRHTELVESLVSHSKQRAGSPINRHKSRCLPHSRELLSYTQYPTPCLSNRPMERISDHKKTAKKTPLLRYLEILSRGL